jgi:hypothetical protein
LSRISASFSLKCHSEKKYANHFFVGLLESGVASDK